MFRKLMFLFAILFSVQVLAQTQQTTLYREDELGNIQYRKEGTMDGNQIRTLFYNNGEVGQWPYQPSGEWPKGTGHSYLDGVALLLVSQITTHGGVVHSLATSYREWMDRDPVTGQIWGLEALPGYAAISSERPSISNNPSTWPSTWPAALDLGTEWDGYWFGYFGRGVMNADVETFYVMDDSKDGEFTRPPYKFYPISSDSTRNGMGLRVEVRGFQWSHVLAEDIIFWHYDVINISEYDRDTTYFGFYTDTGVGGTSDSGDDCASFDRTIDLAYAFDDDGIGSPGSYQTGMYGYAYLESPGNPYDGLNNDEDTDIYGVAMVDERRDDFIDNDGDWMTFSDLNGNGSWDADQNEPLNNDVGVDGVGPFDIQYNGPDEGEGDGFPSRSETSGEPNFDITDKDESDQIGLTAISIYRLGDGGTGGGWPKDDESMWLKMQAENFDTSLQKANISMVFDSGVFPLKSEERERFSMALVFGDNYEDLVLNKETVQEIYNANYNFSKPPLKPTLKAVAGDGKVFLYWDKIAEESRDPFLGFENNDPTQGFKKDFEGYLVYRSREAEFNDIKIITDSKGNKKYWKPIAQFDLADSILGPDPIGINGAHFWRGEDSGLQHSFVDTDVINGVKYYYSVVSYDMGDPAYGTAGLVPSECTKIISEDYSGNIQFVDINCAVVVPNAPSIGYEAPQITGDVSQLSEGIGSGNLSVIVLNEAEILENAQYKVEFTSTGTFPNYETTSSLIIRTHNAEVDTLLSDFSADQFSADVFSEPFDGMVISVVNDTIEVDYENTHWLVGTSNLLMTVHKDETSTAVSYAWPSDYQIQFYDEQVTTTPFFHIPVNFLVFNTTTGDTTQAEIWDNNGDGDLSMGDEIVIIEYIGTRYKLTWRIDYYAPGTPNVQPMEPVAGDIFQIKINKPYLQGDYFTFNTQSANVDSKQAEDDLSKIKVIPNPYIMAAEWEKRNIYQSGRGERRIDWIHLPAECTIRIYTVNGALIKTLYKDYSPTDGTMSWNLLTEDGTEIAFGMYIYHVESPGVGEYIGKFAIIK